MGRRIVAEPTGRWAALRARRRGRPVGWLETPPHGRQKLFLRKGRLYNRNGWDMTDEVHRTKKYVNDGKALVRTTRERTSKGGGR